MPRRKIGLLLSLVMLFPQGACSPRGDYEASLEGKAAYSALEAQKAQLEAQPVSGPYVFTKNAQGSQHDALAFPIHAKNSKYFVVIANAAREDQILRVWRTDEREFKITRATFDEINRKGYVSEPVRNYLRLHIAD